MDVSLGLSHWGRDVGWGCSRTGRWGRYLDAKGTRLQESGEDYTTRSFMLCTLINITRVIKSRRMRCAGHVARMEDRRSAYRVTVGELMERDLGVDGTIILKWIFGMRRPGLDWSGWGWGQVAVSCECGNEPSSSIKCGEFLDLLKTCWLLRKDSASCS